MQTFLLIIFGCVCTIEFIVQATGLPTLLRFAPEAISLIVAIYVFIAGTLNRFRFVPPKYWLILFGLVFIAVCGVINNAPGPGALLNGLRYYFRAAPMFFLPMVLPVNDERLKRQLKVLLALSLLQIPVACYQRWVIFSADRISGDDVRGTIMDSGVLSMFLICAALVLSGLMLRRRIGIFRYAMLFLLLLFPTTINETKVTVILVPFGLFVTLIMGAESGKRLQYAGLSLAILVVFGSIFVPIYNRLEEGQVDIIDFFTSQKSLNRYLVAQGNSKEIGIGSGKTATRGQSIDITLKYMLKDPVTLGFGLGMGNVSPSQSGKNFEGAYFRLFQGVLTISFAFFLLEFGLFGVLLILALNWCIFMDCLAVSRRDHSLTGAVATGWMGVVAIFMLSMVYNNFHFFAAVTYVYWYLSGVVCARREALRHGVDQG